jgi:hypothetical protein
MSVSDAKLTANRQNAQFSTGPRTEPGKKRSSLNALRHGLAGDVVLLPEEDMKIFQAFCQGYHREWRAVGPTEKQLVQTLANNQWRINRAQSRERAVYAIGQDKFADQINTDHPEIQTALTAAMVDIEQSKELDRLSRHGSRIQRDFMNTLKVLQQLQAERKQREEKQIYEASLICKLHEMEKIPFNPADYGFVLTATQIDTYIFRTQRLDAAHIAKKTGYNLEKYLAAGGPAFQVEPAA